MSDMPSSEFRKRYPKLKQFTTVTVNGHPIGSWIPATTHFAPPEDQFKWVPREELLREAAARLPGGGVQSRQAQRDDLLRKINRGK